jgi:hypothetical protein
LRLACNTAPLLKFSSGDAEHPEVSQPDHSNFAGDGPFDPETPWILVYVSAALEPWSQEDLLALLTLARERNAIRGITGMLLYDHGGFMQALEGPRAAVQDLAAAIRRDPRHRSMIVMLDVPRAERYFPAWSMGFRDVADAPAPEGLSRLFADVSERDALAAHPDRVHRLLRHYAETPRGPAPAPLA